MLPFFKIWMIWGTLLASGQKRSPFGSLFFLYYMLLRTSLPPKPEGHCLAPYPPMMPGWTEWVSVFVAFTAICHFLHAVLQPCGTVTSWIIPAPDSSYLSGCLTWERGRGEQGWSFSFRGLVSPFLSYSASSQTHNWPEMQHCTLGWETSKS